MRPSKSGSLLLLPTFVLALVPKCPLCLVAYAGVVGLGSWVAPFSPRLSPWITALTALMLGLALLAMLARQNRSRWISASLAIPAAAVVLASRLSPAAERWMPLGLALVLGAIGVSLVANRAVHDHGAGPGGGIAEKDRCVCDTPTYLPP